MKTKKVGKVMSVISLLAMLSIMIAFAVGVTGATDITHPNMYINASEIDQIKSNVATGEQPWFDSYDKMISDANIALDTPVQSVTYSSSIPPSGDKHDYYTEDPNCGWTRIDGQQPDCRDSINPNVDRADYYAAQIIRDSVRSLGTAYALTGNPKYADKALKLVRAWAIDPSTKMNPTFTNTQSRIEIYITMTGMFYGIDLIYNYSGFTPADKAALKTWSQSLTDQAKSWNGDDIFDIWRLVFLGAGATIAEDTNTLSYVWDRWKSDINNQTDSDGKIKSTLGSSTSLSSGTSGLKGLIIIAEHAKHYNVDLYNYKTVDGKGLEHSLDFYAPYVANPSLWTYMQDMTYKGDNAELYELAYSWEKKDIYKNVIIKWGRPMYDDRALGYVTLTHAKSAVDVNNTVNNIVPLAPLSYTDSSNSTTNNITNVTNINNSTNISSNITNPLNIIPGPINLSSNNAVSNNLTGRVTCYKISKGLITNMLTTLLSPVRTTNFGPGITSPGVISPVYNPPVISSPTGSTGTGSTGIYNPSPTPIIGITNPSPVPSSDVPIGYRLVFNDEFDGSQINTAVWHAPFGQAIDPRATYLDGNGHLVLDTSQSSREPFISTNGHPFGPYGIMDVRAKFADGSTGNKECIDDQIWMDSDGWTWEADLATVSAVRPDMIHATLMNRYPGQCSNPDGCWDGGVENVYNFNVIGQWHTYRMEWTPSYVTFYIENNGIFYGIYTQNNIYYIPKAPMTISLALCVGGCDFPAYCDGSHPPTTTYDIDYVRWYQKQ